MLLLPFILKNRGLSVQVKVLTVVDIRCFGIFCFGVVHINYSNIIIIWYIPGAINCSISSSHDHEKYQHRKISFMAWDYKEHQDRTTFMAQQYECKPNQCEGQKQEQIFDQEQEEEEEHKTCKNNN